MVAGSTQPLHRRTSLDHQIESPFTVDSAESSLHTRHNARMSGTGGEWEWIEVPRLGGPDGSVYKELFANQKYSSAELLAREVIQNSWDAALCHQHGDETPFSVRFRFASLVGQKKATLVEELRLEEVAQRVKLTKEAEVGVRGQTTLNTLVNDDPIQVLYLEDYGAHGLFGDPETEGRESRFRRALYDLGNSPKTGDGARSSGGSYGYGKSAFIQASRLNCVAVYSCFAKRETDEATRRAAASLYWKGHYVEGHEYTGRALLGEVTKTSSGSEEVNPFVNVTADLFARRIGIEKRDPGIVDELGTTFCLIEPNLTPDALRRAVQKWWWPALQDELMDIQIIDAEGNSHTPRPNQEPELRPFIQAYELTRDISSVSGDRQSAKKLPSSASGDPIGVLGLVAPEGDGLSEAALDSDLQSIPWLVATIRKQRMVIEYRRINGGRRQLIRGAFVADDAVDDLLRAAEPPLHDQWQVNTSRDVSTEDRTRIRDAVRAIKDELNTRVREFALQIEPRDSERKRPIQMMDDLIARLAAGRHVGPPPPPPGGTLPVQIKGSQRLYAEDAGMVRSEFELKLQLQDAASKSVRKCLVELDFRWDEGDRHSRDMVPMAVSASKDADLSEVEPGVIEVRVYKDRPIEIKLKTDSYPDMWSIVGQPRVRYSSDGKAAKGRASG